ncbi:hypothetical protein AJ79_03645 [Helicocarpus griseus UAMH5409]|uniref:Uncharacterized protein n=1 Tax=Helicocarpus griseus UAMH5409 TaxID=1447875 RepID=A0A2B7XP17_9EURO|nr:hypothetical protein AJ79_03645 [Helicocarpus griseus UAMH5409]
MSVTVNSRIGQLEELFPRNQVDLEREDGDVERLIPWIFRHADTAGEDCMDHWPDDEDVFSLLFDYLSVYCSRVQAWEANEGHQSGTLGVTSALRTRQAITLPRKSWAVAEKKRVGRLTDSQAVILQQLMKTVYWNLENVKRQNLKIRWVTSSHNQTYVIGGKRYGTRPEDAVTVGLNRLPIISYTPWFYDQTWSEFLEQTVSIMLGQLALDMSVDSGSTGSRDQEVFVVGFHGSYFHIGHALFTADVISRVHSRGCSQDEVVGLEFTHGYNLCLKKDWLEAMRALVRLFRYIVSGDSKIGVIQALLEGTANNLGEAV